MSQSITNPSESSPVLGSSPTGVSWFIDRAGDPSLLENDTSDPVTILEDLGFIQSRHSTINNSRYFEAYNIAANISAARSRNNLNININNNRNNTFRFENFAIENTIVNTIVSVLVDEEMKVSTEQQDCCICMEEKEKTDICLLGCSHSFCVDCSGNNFAAQIRRNENISCPLCRAEVTNIRVQSIANRDKFLTPP
jgi:hypothetical protein